PNSYPAYGFTMPVNQWIHLAMSFDGTLSTMYLNGASIGSDLFSFASDTASALTIGACEANGGNPWKGAIDDVRIYDRALTAAEVGRLAEGKGLSNALETQMLNLNASCRMRQSFQVEDPAVFDGLALRIRYEDGFVAYLNGQKVAERNAPTTLSWNSTATTDRPDGESLSFEEINLTAYLGILQATPAVNVLAIQGLNNAAGNGEYLIEPVLVATQDLDTAQYFTTPTPGSANISGALGIVEEIEFSHKRGFYAAGFSLTLASDTPGAEIRYTLDGTAPSATTGTVYTGPIAISATSIVRAMGFKPGWLDSAVKTHTYLFIADILQQSPTGAAPSADWPAAGTFNNQVMNYGMDPDIVTVDSRYKTLVDDALVAIPSLSIVTDPNHLFNAGNGIYVNASQDGRAWERPVSLELIDPSGNDGFQINCGLRIRGGYSRSGDNPKHAFRVFFRGEYGEGKLNYPLFGDEGADSFDKVDIQTSQNYSWSFGGDSRNTMCREIFSRDTQRAMGQPYTRSRYYHLYLNGQYWGLYLTQERCEARYAETYFGGSKDDYDVVKVEAGSYTINATDGTLDKWQTIFNALDTFKNAEPYFRFQGLNTDGTANASYERFLDIDNLIDYMICTYYVGDFDGPVSNFLGNTSPNNFYGIYNRVHPDGFKFFRHDAEHSLFDDNSWGIDRTGPFPAGQTFDKFNPQYLSQKLAENIEYRVRFGDRVHKYFYNGGLLTSSSASQRFLARAATIDTAIIAESARWGDSKTSTNLNRNDHWLPQINYISGTYMNNRPAIVLNQLIGKGWYPNVAAPSFSPFGGYVNPGYSLTMSNPGGGDLYYTLDGTDPRKYSHLSTPGADVTLAAESAAKKVFVPTTEPVSALGAIRADYWFGISGTAVSNLTSNANYPDNPSLTEYRTVFESRTGDPWDQYGARLSGYLHPPVTGNYTFWIASDDGGELWLSTTESPTNAVKIAQVSGWTGTRQWDWYAEQKSAAIPLTAGQKYYIYALMKEEGGGDNLSVAWQGPNITRQVIDGQNLSPAGNPWMNIVYDDSGWTAGSGTVGFETRPSDPVNYTDLIDMDLQTAMYTKNASCYIRIPFTAPNLDYSSLTLKVRYDDGFIAYLNGAEVKRVNFDSAAAPVWNSAANASHTDALAREFESFDLTAHLGKLKKGATNMLAIQGLNITAGNNDFLLGAELVAGQISPGDPSATAIRYTGPVTLTQSTAVKARALNGKWSALNEAVFAIGPVKESLRITEIMYNPAILNTEYIELQNVGTSSINLNLVRFTRGIDFTFGDTTLAPGGAVLVVQDVAAFEAFYGTGLPIAGHYTGLLDNAGERIQLVDAIGTVIHDFEYKDGWYDITDGPGFSLTILDPSASDLMVWGQKSGWRASAMAYGSPGSDDMGLVPGPGAVVINEILSHSHGGEITPDWIELHNTTDEPINIGGWFLSDSNIDDPNKMKYEIASDTILPRNGFAVFYQDLHFGNPADPGCHAPFALSEGGETIYLQSGQGGALTGYTVEQQFDAAESGVAFGRYIKSSLDGGVNFVAMSANTPGYGNAAPKVGPIVITEMMYNPNSANTGDEYIELKNISGAPVTLQDEVGTETSPGVFRTDIVPWQFTNGIEFAFPANTTIPAGGYLIVCKDKTKLKAYYGAAIPSSVTILQWTSGSLDNAGEKVRLSKPGDQELGQDRYWIRAEQISYDDVAPWPVEPDGTGKVLQRIDPTAYGNDAANWQAGDPSPGKQ
ncbi:MAG: hypothetical protein GX455_09235, partial [Phycisphaerae bacterium]|nr:hypothetical protein [Phycisphaerae bacterium]